MELWRKGKVSANAFLSYGLQGADVGYNVTDSVKVKIGAGIEKFKKPVGYAGVSWSF